MITRENIKDVFRADVDIRENRYSKLPEISLIPGPSGDRQVEE